MTTHESIDVRKANRVALGIQVAVRIKSDTASYLTENTELINASVNGAGFYLENEVKIGQLISLMLAFPVHMRMYDKDKELYRVWGIVQYCNKLTDDGEEKYQVGVAFIGRSAPSSYQKDPKQNYFICGVSDEGLWIVKESKKEFINRRHARHWMPIDVELSLINSQGIVSASDKTVTENISISGAALVTNLSANVGDFLGITASEFEFSATAVVRGRVDLDYGKVRLSLEFTDALFPIHKTGENIAEVEEDEEKPNEQTEDAAIKTDDEQLVDLTDSVEEVYDAEIVETGFEIKQG